MALERTQNVRVIDGEVERVLYSLAQAKGDMLVAKVAGQFYRIGVGADGQVLVARAAAEVGVQWENQQEAGATAFTDLSDVPSAYTGEAGKVATVKSAEDGLEFTTLPATVPLFLTPFVAPVLSEFSWINQGSSTAVQTTRGIYVLAQSESGQQRILKKSLTGDYTITVRFIINALTDSVSWIGFVWRESGTGKIVVFGYHCSLGQLFVSKFDSPADVTATDYYRKQLASVATGGGFVSLRAQVTGGARKCFASFDDEHWFELHSISSSDFITADEVGLALYEVDTGDMLGAHFIHWKQEA